MRCFAEQGAKATTIRTVAGQAGVTPGLVSHHFGTKQGLRDACDAYVLEYLRDGITTGIDERGLADPDFLSSVYDSAPVVLRYLGRALVDGSTAAASLFDNIVTLTQDYLAGHPPQQGATRADPRDQAAVLIAMRLGMWVLHDHLVRALDADALTSEVLSRVSAALVDIMSPEFTGADLLAVARSGLARYQ
jgi:AcrR family transcriptional regulator